MNATKINTAQVIIPEKMSSYLESLNYEVNARKDLIAFCIERGINTDNEVFKRYHKEYVDFVAQYNMAKKEIEELYVRNKYPKAKWSLNFKTRTLNIEINEVAQ